MGTTLPKLEKPQNFSYQFLFNQKEPHQQESLSLIQKLHQTKTKKFKKEESEKEEDSEKKEENEGLNDKKKGDHKKPETKDFEEKEIIIESLDSEQFEKSSSDEKEYDQDIEDIVIDENVIDDQYGRISNEEEGEEEEKKEEEEEEKDNKIEEIISNEIAISEQSGRFPEEEEEDDDDNDDDDDDDEEEAEEEEKEKQEEEEKDNKIEEIISNEIAISEQSGRFPEEVDDDDDEEEEEEAEEENEKEKQEEEEEKDNKIEEILSDEIAISEQSGRFSEEEEEEEEEEESNENLDSGSESLNISDTPSENESEGKSEEDENNIEPEPMWSPEEESESSGDEEDLTNEWIINRRLLNKIQNMQDHEIQQLYQRSIHKKNNEESKLLFTLKPDAYRKKNEISTEKIIPRFFIGTLKNMIFNLDEKFVKMEYQLLSDAIQNILLNVTKKVQNYSDKLINKLKIYLFVINKYHKIYPDKQMEWESDKLTTIMKNKSKWITNEIIDQLKGFFKKTMHFFLDVLINSEVIAFAYLEKDSTFDEESCINIEEDLEEYEDEDELPQFVQLFPIIYRDEKIIKRGIVVFIEQYNEEIILGERKD